MKTGTGSTQDLNNEKFSVITNSSHVSIAQLTSHRANSTKMVRA